MSDWLPQLDAWCALPRSDRRAIYEWAHAEIETLPECYAIRGRFDVRNSPWLIEPFHSCQDLRCRRTTVSKSVQSAGTLLAEIVTAWRLANDPGPCTFTMQSDEMAGLEAKTRLWPLLRAIPSVFRLLPKPGPMFTQQEIFFNGFFLFMNSANLAHQQSTSVRYKVNDEIWMPKWADVYTDACARVTAFEQQGTSHILDISQGGHEGDAAEESFMNGSQERWGAKCQGCGKSFELINAFLNDDEKKTLTQVNACFDPSARRDDGTYDVERAAETVRYVCPYCGYEHPDNDFTREHWRQTGYYSAPRAGAPKDWRSFHWEACVAHPLHLLAREFCRAENHFHRTGDPELRKKYTQKRRGLSWKEERTTITLSPAASTYRTEEYGDGQPVPGEILRTAAIDKQQDHWWVEIGAWGMTATSPLFYRQLHFGRCETREQIKLLLVKYHVEPCYVAQDRAYKPQEVDLDCVTFGWCGIAGSTTKRKRWPIKEEGSKQVINYPYSPTFLSPVDYGRDAPYVEFDGDYFKDILANAISGAGSLRWQVPQDVNQLWIEHIKGESKQEVSPGRWEWREVKVNAPNHGLDTSVIQLVIAMARGVVRFEEK